MNRFAVSLLLLLSCLLVVGPLRADDKHIDFDEETDFSKYESFDVRRQVITAKAPELNSSLVKDRIANAIRRELSNDGLFKDATQPELLVNFHLGAETEKEVETFRTGRRLRRERVVVDTHAEGTLVVDLVERNSGELVWRGIYEDREGDFGKLAKKLDEDVKKLFADYPPKKK